MSRGRISVILTEVGIRNNYISSEFLQNPKRINDEMTGAGNFLNKWMSSNQRFIPKLRYRK